MQLVTVTAITPFTYEGREIRRGQPVSMKPVDAAIHARQGHVSLSRPEKKSSRRNTYRTRDLVAERLP